MPNGNGGGGPKPPETINVTCSSKSDKLAYFIGDETSPDRSEVRLYLAGTTEYFTVGKSYEVTFKPL